MARVHRARAWKAGRPRATLATPMSRYQTLEVAADGALLHIRLNRPDVRNAFNGTVVDELTAAIGTGSGPRLHALAHFRDVSAVQISREVKSCSRETTFPPLSPMLQ